MMTPLESNVYVFAARYAHHRKTGAALMVVNAILAVWDELPVDIQLQLIDEAWHEAEYCREDWYPLLDKMKRLDNT